MGDRRKGDRRAPEEGVIRIEKKNLVIYLILIAVLIVVLILNIVSWSAYIRYKRQYNAMVEYYYNSDKNSVVEQNKSSVNNNYTCDFSVGKEKIKISKGDTKSYDIKISNIKADTGIIIFESQINYNSDVFECTIESDEKNMWNKTSMIGNVLTMTRTDLLPSSENQVIGKLTLKAKDNATTGIYKIDFSKIKFTMDNDKAFGIDDKSINIEVVENTNS